MSKQARLASKVAKELEELQNNVPLKKRLLDVCTYCSSNPTSATPRHTDIEVSEDEDDGMDDSLFRDEADRIRLLSLPALQRETELYERAELRRNIEERNRLRRERRQQLYQQQNPQSQDRSKASKASAHARLEQLAARRKRTQRDTYSEPSEISEDSEGDIEVDGDWSDRSKRADRESRLEKVDRPERHRPDLVATTPALVSVPPPQLEDFLPCVVARSQLLGWYGKPYWSDVYPGLYVRVLVGQGSEGPVYRIAEIIDMTPAPAPYRVGEVDIDVRALLRIGSSNLEYSRFLKQLEKASNSFPTESQLTRLASQIEYASTYVLTEADVAAEVRRHQNSSRTRMNFPKQMQLLQDQLLDELTSGNTERASAIQRELDDLFAQAEARRRDTRVNMSAINKRNQRLNVDTLGASRDLLLKLQRDEMEGRIDTADDPFARRMESSGAVRPLPRPQTDSSSLTTPKRAREDSDELPDPSIKRPRHNVDTTPERATSAAETSQGKRKISLSDYMNRNQPVRT